MPYQGYSEFDQNEGTPYTRNKDDLLEDESQNMQRIGESPFNSPFLKRNDMMLGKQSLDRQTANVEILPNG